MISEIDRVKLGKDRDVAQPGLHLPVTILADGIFLFGDRKILITKYFLSNLCIFGRLIHTVVHNAEGENILLSYEHRKN